VISSLLTVIVVQKEDLEESAGSFKTCNQDSKVYEKVFAILIRKRFLNNQNNFSFIHHIACLG